MPEQEEMSAKCHAAMVKKQRNYSEKKARKKSNKAARLLESVDATEPPNPRKGDVVVSGSQKIVNGKPFGGCSGKGMKEPERVVEWEVDPDVIECERNKEEDAKQKAIEENLKHWPWGQKVPRGLVTLAPYLLNELRDSSITGQPFAQPEAQQKCLLFEKIFSVDLIAQKIIDLLFLNHDTAASFALTSRRSAREISRNIGHWDATRGYFGNCEIERYNLLDNDDFVAEAKKGSVPSVIVVSPVRGPLLTPRNIEELDEVGDKLRERFYELQVSVIHKMCKAMYNFADFFRNIQFHQIPFLSVEVLSLIVPPMRNLKVLGVYNCQLIHLGHTLKLLEIVQVDKVQEKNNQISLDFCPNFHSGPIATVDNHYHTGNYHVTWDNWNGDSRLGIWQLISRIIPQALEQKQDFLSPHTAFRQWLDKSPCWRVAETLATLQCLPGDTRSDDEIDEDFVVMVDSPNTGGRKEKFMSKVPNRPEGWQWMLQRHPCYRCGLNPLGIFFYYVDIRDAAAGHGGWAPSDMICMACRLCQVLDRESDHYKLSKRKIIEYWLQDELDDDQFRTEPTWNDTNMPKALDDFVKRKVAIRAAWLDHIRLNAIRGVPRYKYVRGTDDRLPLVGDTVHLKLEPMDPELAARQVPFTKGQLGRLGWKNLSPTVESKDPNEDEWSYWDASRRFAHGH